MDKFTFILSLVSVDLCFGECRSRSACTYVQSDLDLHFPLFYHSFLSKILHPVSYNAFLNDKQNEFPDNNFEFDEKGGTFSKRVENTVEKGEIVRYEQFLLVQSCFQKTFSADF